MRKIFAVLFFSIFLFSATNVLADYSIFRNNFKRIGSSNYSISSSLDKNTNYPVVSKIQKDPISDSESNIYLSLWNYGLQVFDKNGNFLWKSNTPEPTGSPAFDSDGNLYFCAGASTSNPYVYSFTKGGQKRWEYSLRPPGSYYSNPCSSSPAMSPNRDTLYITTDWPTQTILAFNLDGSLKWESRIWYTPGSASIAVADDGTLYVGTDGYGKIFALNPNGTIKWSYAIGTVINTPVVGDDGNIYASFTGWNSSGIISFTQSGTLRWNHNFNISFYAKEISFRNNTVYAASPNQVIAINATTGEKKWIWGTTYNYWPIHYLTVDTNGNSFVALDDTLYAIDSNGQTLWSKKLSKYLEYITIFDNDKILVTQTYSGQYSYYILEKDAPTKTPIIIVPGIGASFNFGIWTDRGDSGWKWMLTTDSSWRQFIDSLEKAGYQKDKDYFIAFYDWRKTNDWNDPDPGAALPAKKYLAETIDKAKIANPGVSKVNVVAHSMGGLVVRSYVESPNYRGDIDKAFLIGSPNNGSTFAYYTWEGGEVPPNWDPVSKSALGVTIKLLSFNFNKEPYQMIHDHMKGIKDLLPVGYDYILINNNPLNWLNMQEINIFLKDTSKSQDTSAIFTNKGVKLINISGTGQVTWEKIQAQDYLNQYLWKDGKPLGESSTADGDNTVLASSSNLPGAEQLTVNSNHANLPNVATSLIFDKLGINFIPSSLAGAPNEVMVAWVASPVTLTVKDSEGNSIGELLTDPETDRKWVFVENPTGDYKLILTGTGAGEYHVGVDYYTDTKTESLKTQGTAVTGAELNYDLHLNPQSTQPVDLQPEDKIPPTTSLQIQGTSGNNDWYVSDVNISLTSADNTNGSGVDKTEYSFDNITWQKYTTPLIINKEGATSIYYRSFDLVGNQELIQQTDIKIDKTPPEAKIFVDPDIDDLVIKGVDQNQTIIQKLDNMETKKKDDAIYIITDEAGNTLKIDVRERDKNKQDRFRIYSLQYNNNSKQILENNHFNVTYQGKKGKLNIKEQNFELKGEIKIRIQYDLKRDKSTIIMKESKEEKVKEIKNGLTILFLNTNKGQLETTY